MADLDQDQKSLCDSDRIRETNFQKTPAFQVESQQGSRNECSAFYIETVQATKNAVYQQQQVIDASIKSWLATIHDLIVQARKQAISFIIIQLDPQSDVAKKVIQDDMLTGFTISPHEYVSGSFRNEDYYAIGLEIRWNVKI